MAVRIRMKKLGRKHRPFYRICAVDSRSPRDGRVIEELGTYDTSIADTDARCSIKGERVQYWLGVGAQPSDKVRVLVKKYGLNGTHLDAQAAARERMALPKAIPDPGEPAFKLEPKAPKAEAGPDAAAAQAPVAAPAETPASDAAETAVEAPAAEAPAAEAPANDASSEPAVESSDTETAVAEDKKTE